jgi:hypothetical protein
MTIDKGKRDACTISSLVLGISLMMLEGKGKGRQTDSQTARQRDRETERQRDRETERQKKKRVSVR